jgi:hypothetical protein
MPGMTLGMVPYDHAVSQDRRFVLNQVLETSSTPITLILNWRFSQTSLLECIE